MASSDRGTRKLAAIMFTDIKSFSKKMSENEELAMQLLRIHDDTLKATIEKYEGKIVKAIGDAFMVDFSSAVNAVKCATESQEAFYAYNKGKTDLEKIEVRIGVHLGDVITDGNDIFGDGVNIAARIEAVAQPNRICISHDVYSQIKNKMQLKTFHMGSISLKNIPEPVEVYEILMDSIPEYSVPSKGAQQMPSKRTAEKTTKQEAKEAEEVEATRKRAEEDRQEADEENQEKVRKLFEKAEKLFAGGKSEEAERELSEIFKIVAFHAGAQVLQGKIEEEKEKKADEGRRKGAARRKIEQRINELSTEALSMVGDDNFTEALLKVQEIYKIDPDNKGAKDLEAQIGEAQKAKEELERQRSEADVPLPTGPPTPDTEEPTAESAETTDVELSEEAETESDKRTGAPAARRSVGLRMPTKHISPALRNTAIVVILAVLVFVFFPQIQKFIVPHDTTIVVAPFEVSGGSDTTYIGAAIASMISEDLARYPELVVVRPGAPSERSVHPLALAKSLQARYVLSGQILSFYPKLTVKISLNVADVQAPLWERSVESDPFSLGPLRAEVARNILSSLELERESNVAPQLSSIPLINMEYLLGVGASLRFKREEAARAAVLFRQTIAYDTTLAQAHIGLGRALLRLYKTEGERDRTYLRDAVNAAVAARSLNGSLPGAYEVLGSAYRNAGRYSQALQNLERAVQLEPGNAESYRQLCMIAIVKGDFDQAMEHGSKALLMDPRHPDSHEVMGHVYYFKRQHNSALSAYDQAIALGNSASLITTRFKVALWGAGLSPEPVAEYGNRILREDSTNYVVKYWIGRAYMLSGFWTQAKGYLESGLEHLKVFIERNPDDAFASGYLALYRVRLGESVLGLEGIDKAIEQDSESAMLLYRKAQFYSIQNDKKEEALEWLRKAVRQEYILWEIMSPDFAFIAEDPEFRQAIALKISASE
ncbi:MAG: adenylate/guanylate cyclase domain-containing protein [Bacteroidota bacterium]